MKMWQDYFTHGMIVRQERWAVKEQKDYVTFGPLDGVFIYRWLPERRKVTRNRSLEGESRYL